MNYLIGKNILVISPEGWGKSKLSKHHYAIELAKSNKVWFLGPVYAEVTKENMEDAYPVSLIADFFSMRGFRFLPHFLQRIILAKRVEKLQKKAGVRFNVVWNFDNSRYYHLDVFKDAFCIHHKMDFHVNYQNEMACKTAHLCLGVTHGIIDQMAPFNHRVHFVQHGYVETQKVNVVLPKTNLPYSALYVGNLLIPFINWEWLLRLISSNSDVQFYFIGSFGRGNLNPFAEEEAIENITKLKSLPNAMLLGVCSANEIASYSEQADILLAVYDSMKYPDITANSHKIMNYLGSGKPIVSNVFKEYDAGISLLYMAKTMDDFLKTFDHVKRNKSIYQSLELTKRRKQFACDNSYSNQLARIDSLIQERV